MRSPSTASVCARSTASWGCVRYRDHRALQRRQRGPLARTVRADAADGAIQPLVGRERSWRELADTYRTIGADGRVAVIEGESGVGKTRLAEEFLQATPGAPVIAARAHPGERGLAYGVLAQLLRGAIEIASAPFPSIAGLRQLGCCPSWASRPRRGCPSPVRASGSWTPLVRRWRRPVCPALRRSCSSMTCTPPIRPRSTPSPTSVTGFRAAGYCCSPPAARMSPTPSTPARGSRIWANAWRWHDSPVPTSWSSRGYPDSTRAPGIACTPRARACPCTSPSCWRREGLTRLPAARARSSPRDSTRSPRPPPR